MAKQFLAHVICVGVLISAPSISRAQTQEASSQVTVQGVVQAVDHTLRTVTIRDLYGKVVTLDVPADAMRFDQVKVGDPVTATYYDRVTVRLKPPGEPAVNRTEEPTMTAAPGALPGATRTKQRVATVTITGWSPVDRVVTFIGPDGTAYSRGLLDTTDPAIVEGLKVGDRVDVTRTEAVTISVQSIAVPSTANDDELRHRFTASLLIGWDNTVSGTMIKEATGQTVAGAPINLRETTYNDVYGRIGILKLGVGFRTTPRAEAVFNFVWSSSDAEDGGVRIGTVGNPAIPLTVEFTAFKYWGLEAGQRFFFARTRFTPFVGYLVGVNRHQDIRGTFVDVPPNLIPGLVAQDGKFFEKSWAISLGPTGGALIGVGPFELMAETQLRFMGGLSDVDWLVEQGLKDINTESSRWSFPFLVGARIRF